MKGVALLATAVLFIIALAGSASAFSYTGYMTPMGDVADVVIPDSGISVERLNFYTTDSDGRFKLRIFQHDDIGLRRESPFGRDRLQGR